MVLYCTGGVNSTESPRERLDALLTLSYFFVPRCSARFVLILILILFAFLFLSSIVILSHQIPKFCLQAFVLVSPVSCSETLVSTMIAFLTRSQY
jgi:hypothetical protein